MSCIMAELVKVFNGMFKGDWDNISDKDKEECFFIFNRFLSKKYPEKSQLLNDKRIDKVMAMNIWHAYMYRQPYPKWFWSKSEKKEKSNVSEKDFKSLIKFLQIKPFDLNYLIDNHYEFVKDELDYIKKLDKL